MGKRKTVATQSYHRDFVVMVQFEYHYWSGGYTRLYT